jgi:anti-anti-sigma factor
VAESNEVPPGVPARAVVAPGADAVVVAVRGVVDVARVADVVRRMDVTSASRPPVGAVVCDLAGATSCDAEAVGALARVALAARRRGLTLWVRNPRPELCELVELVGLTHVLPVWEAPDPADRGPPAA